MTILWSSASDPLPATPAPLLDHIPPQWHHGSLPHLLLHWPNHHLASDRSQLPSLCLLKLHAAAWSYSTVIGSLFHRSWSTGNHFSTSTSHFRTKTYWSYLVIEWKCTLKCTSWTLEVELWTEPHRKTHPWSLGVHRLCDGYGSSSWSSSSTEDCQYKIIVVVHHVGDPSPLCVLSQG